MKSKSLITVVTVVALVGLATTSMAACAPATPIAASIASANATRQAEHDGTETASTRLRPDPRDLSVVELASPMPADATWMAERMDRQIESWNQTYVPPPTMSPRVLRWAGDCESPPNVGPALEPGRVVSVDFSGATWTIENHGKWTVYPRHGLESHDPFSVGSREGCGDVLYVTKCVVVVDPVSGETSYTTGQVYRSTATPGPDGYTCATPGNLGEPTETKEPGHDAPAPTPTMSDEVLRQTTSCENWRVGPEIEPGRLVSATYDDGMWIIVVEGLWEFQSIPKSTSPPHPRGSPGAAPTREPWRDLSYVASCTKKIYPRSRYAHEQSAHMVTATPPSR